MKHIELKLNIPTSIKDVKEMWKTHTDKRYSHNRKVVIKMYNTMLLKMKSNYWSNDISDYFRENFEYTSVDTNGCKNLLQNTLKELQ